MEMIPDSKYDDESQSGVTPSCLTLCDSMDCTLPGSSINGVFQARLLNGKAFRKPWDYDKAHRGLLRFALKVM